MDRYELQLQEADRNYGMIGREKRAYAIGYQIGFEAVKETDIKPGLDKVESIINLIYAQPDKVLFFARLGFMNATQPIRPKF
jgi:hypothetical protein